MKSSPVLNNHTPQMCKVDLARPEGVKPLLGAVPTALLSQLTFPHKKKNWAPEGHHLLVKT